MTSVARRRLAPGSEFVAYLMVSVLALGVDVAVLLSLSRVFHYLAAASAGFLVGAMVSYVLSTTWAFRFRRLAHRRRVEFSLFVSVGLGALVLSNVAIFVGVDVLGIELLAAKVVAAGASFMFGFACRKWILFR